MDDFRGFPASALRQKEVESFILVWLLPRLPLPNLCYTDINMQTNTLEGTRHPWPAWSGFLHTYGLESFAAFFLESVGPFGILGAQILHFTGPFLAPALDEGQRNALAGLLEDRDEALAFAAYLREDSAL